jgi:hypothetical protein
VANARNQPRTSTTSTTSAPTKTAAAKPASATKTRAATKAAGATKTGVTAKTGDAKASKSSTTPSPVYTVTIPVDRLVSATVGATVSVAKIPVAVVRRVVPTKGGLPVYLGLGGLAVVGVVEWPVAAVAGAGFAALRRWGPLRPAAVEEVQISAAVVEEEGK